MTELVVKPGDVYDRLTILELYENKKDKNWSKTWRCLCECGEVVFARQDWLRHEPGIKQCRTCFKKYRVSVRSWNRLHIEPGQRFGTVTIEKCLEHSISPKNVHYLCRCECGNTRVLKANELRSEPTCNIGLCQKRVRRQKWIGELSGKHWYTIQRCARKRNIPVNITQQYAWDLFVAQDGKCALTGIELFMDDLRKCRECTASLDRINSFPSYTDGHLQWIHKALNAMKMKVTDDQFIEWAKLVVQHSLFKDCLPPTNYTDKYPQLHRIKPKRVACGLVEGVYWTSIKDKARRRQIPVQVTIADLWELLQKQDCRCALTGVELVFRTHYKQPLKVQTGSLDRIDSLGPYVLSNVRWVHKRINTMRLDYTDKEFLYWCKLVSEYNTMKRQSKQLVA